VYVENIGLSVAEVEIVTGVTCLQDIFYTIYILGSVRLKVKLPMMLEIDNKWLVDIVHSLTGVK